MEAEFPWNQDYQKSIISHAWNVDHNELAIAPVLQYNGYSDVWIYSAKDDKVKNWRKMHVLRAHPMRITGIDWSHSTNAIVTASEDRNAYVWTKQNNEWKPTMCVSRIGRSATCIKWSPNGKKFAVGSVKQISVCHYLERGDFWRCPKMIRKAGTSTILSLDWSPNNMFIITGGFDFKCRIFSAYIKDVDIDCKVDDYGAAIDSKEAVKSGTLLCEFDTWPQVGWIESCKFSPSGMRVAFTGHDSTIYFGSLYDDKTTVQCLKRRELPLKCIAFLTDTIVVAAGYDCVPILYEYDGKQWIEKGSIDGGTSKIDKRALQCRHQNTINDIRIYDDGRFTTCSDDGQVLFWDLNSCQETKRFKNEYKENNNDIVRQKQLLNDLEGLNVEIEQLKESISMKQIMIETQIHNISTLEIQHEQNENMLKVQMDTLQHENAKLKQRANGLEDERKEYEMTIIDLKQKIKTLKMKAININEFKEWDEDEVLNWIYSIENGLFMKYKQKLNEEIKSCEIKGEDLVKVTRSDIKEFGVTKFSDQKILQEHIEKLKQIDKNQPNDNNAIAEGNVVPTAYI